MEMEYMETVHQNTTALDAYKRNSQNGEDLRFESISGRRWSATYLLDIDDYNDCESVELTFKINHSMCLYPFNSQRLSYCTHACFDDKNGASLSASTGVQLVNHRCVY